MILGIGVDLCLIEPIRRSICHFGNDWLDEVFTKTEQIACATVEDPNLQFAVIFAIKEACAKALGYGFAEGVSRMDFDATISAKVKVDLSGVALRHALGLPSSNLSIFVTADVDSVNDWVMAFVIIERIALPDENVDGN